MEGTGCPLGIRPLDGSEGDDFDRDDFAGEDEDIEGISDLFTATTARGEILATAELELLSSVVVLVLVLIVVLALIVVVLIVVVLIVVVLIVVLLFEEEEEEEF